MADSPLQLVSEKEEGPPALPHNIDAEAALLGALLIDNRLVDDVQRIIREEHFFEPTHGRIYDAIIRMVVDKNMVANPVTLKPIFDKDEALKALGGVSYLVKITESGVALIGARDFAQQIYELAMLRALIGVGRDMVEKAVDTSEAVDPREQIEEAEVALYEVAEKDGESGSTKQFVRAAAESVEMARIAMNSGGGVSGYTTGFESLNRQLAGLHKSDLIILAARPGMGKTALATNIAFNAALRHTQDMEDGIEESIGAPVAFFSLEMSADQLATRILSEQSKIGSEKLRKGAISQQEFRDLARVATELESLPFYIDDTPGLTIAALRTRARRLKRQKGIGIIVVGLSPAAPGVGADQPAKSRTGNFGDQPWAEDARQGARSAGARAVAAQPRRRAARGQETAAFRSARIGLDRAGRRYCPLHLSRGLLSYHARTFRCEFGRSPSVARTDGKKLRCR